MTRFILRSILLIWVLSSIRAEVCLGWQDIVWDQVPNPSVTQVIDRELPDAPDFSTFLMNDFVVEKQTKINQIVTYFTNDSQTWVDLITEARFCFVPDPLTNDFDPQLDGQVVPANAFVTNDGYVAVIAEIAIAPTPGR